jgi:hypothetical protein
MAAMARACGCAAGAFEQAVIHVHKQASAKALAPLDNVDRNVPLPSTALVLSKAYAGLLVVLYDLMPVAVSGAQIFLIGVNSAEKRHFDFFYTSDMVMECGFTDSTVILIITMPRRACRRSPLSGISKQHQNSRFRRPADALSIGGLFHVCSQTEIKRK